ncbi:putative ABC transport system permease protein [Flavobacteriaceae bacterium MAR_2010_105]|nr:putative ABC transport system permease protein [Flavobacteriaceae bacterium MAR_2010_105]
MIRNYIKIAWRSLKSNKLFTAVNIFGLTVGLASCMLICLYIYHEYSYDKHHDNVEQLYQVGTVLKRTDGDIRTAGTPYGIADALQQEFPEIDNITRLVSLFVDDKTLIQFDNNGTSQVYYESKGYLTDASFFNFFNYDFIEGQPETALQQPNSIVISEAIAAKIFGNEKALDQTLQIESNTNGRGTYVVKGVFKSSNNPSHIDGRFFMSFVGGALDNYVKSQTSMAGNNFVFTYLKLNKGANQDAITAKFPGFVDKYLGADLKKAGFNKEQFLIPVKDIHLKSGMSENVSTSGSPKQLYILLSIAAFILLIACINYMNLSTARSSKRAGEVGVRKVLGAQKSNLITQFLSESILLALMAFIIAIGIVWSLFSTFERISGKEFAYSNNQYLTLGAAFLIVSLLVGLFAGSYPAFFLSAFKPIKVLKGRVTNSLAATTLRKGLVVFQFTIAIILIVSSLVIFNQMEYLKSTDLGFAQDQQIVVPLRSETSVNAYQNIKIDLEKFTAIKAVGAAAYYPGIFNPEDGLFYKEGQNMDLAKHVFFNRVDHDFLKTLEIKLVAGRLFSEPFADSTGIVLNEKAIGEFGFNTAEDAIGKKIFTERQSTLYSNEIVGVVKDFHFKDLKSPITPFAFALELNNYNYMVVHVEEDKISKAIAEISSVWTKSNPNQPLEYTFLNEDFQKNYVSENRLSSIVGYFTLVAILISCLGLFGLISFSADQRKKEIGVRKVLGASISNIVKTLSVEFLVLVLIAILLALPLAYWAMDKWLQEFAYSVGLSWWLFGIAASITLLIAMLTVSHQAVKAAIANPVINLRTE